MSYRAPVGDMRFLLEHVIGAGRLAETERFAEATPDTAEAILSEAAKLAEEVLAPLRRAGDLTPAALENGVVRTSPGFPEAYRAVAEGGWVGMAADPANGGMGLPVTLLSCVNEMMGSANLALAICPLLSQGQIEALEHHADDRVRELCLPRLIAGDWTGTMNLTEPQAGSDVGAVRTRAEPDGAGGYRITGQKIYISWGDHDVAENVCHLVLARLPDAVPGTKGISLFLVPKRLPDAEGRAGVANAVRTVSLEHKLGLHGSPTCVMEFDGATGWLIGAPHSGMAAMFTMMNNARLGVGVHGVSQAEAALQAAVAFARERRQGRTAEAGVDTILGHADVRRMLMSMAALTTSARATCLDCALAIDMAAATGEDAWSARAAFLTPIAKAFGTNTGCEVADLAIQVHGGMGYIEETGVAQYFRDVRVTAIYEGTNGIQAMDLVGRKLADGGAAARALTGEIAATAAAAGGDAGARLAGAVRALDAATDWMVAADPADRAAGAADYLRAFALVLGGHYLLKAARADAAGGHYAALADVHVHRHLPAAAAHLEAARDGAAPLFAWDLASRMDGDAADGRFPFAPPDAGAAVEIAPGVLWLRLPLRMRPDHVNVYALDDGDGWTVVDTGLATDAIRAAWGELLAGPLGGRPVRRVILTHHHPDHVGLAGWFQSVHGAELWATRTAWLFARMLTLDVQDRPTPETLAFWRAAGMDPEILAERAASRPFNFADAVAPMPLGFRRIVQGEEITAGGRRWRVEIGHGHAPEHATLWGVDHDLVLAGDQILPGITPNLGVYATEPEADPVGDWIASCDRLAGLARPGHLALPGHRRPFTGVGARLAELAEHQRGTLARLGAFLDGPRRASDCFAPLYGRPIAPAEYGLALVEAVGHLNHLTRTGAATRSRGADGAWRWRRIENSPDSAAAAE